MDSPPNLNETLLPNPPLDLPLTSRRKDILPLRVSLLEPLGASSKDHTPRTSLAPVGVSRSPVPDTQFRQSSCLDGAESVGCKANDTKHANRELRIQLADVAKEWDDVLRVAAPSSYPRYSLKWFKAYLTRAFMSRYYDMLMVVPIVVLVVVISQYQYSVNDGPLYHKSSSFPGIFILEQCLTLLFVAEIALKMLVLGVRTGRTNFFSLSHCLDLLWTACGLAVLFIALYPHTRSWEIVVRVCRGLSIFRLNRITRALPGLELFGNALLDRTGVLGDVALFFLLFLTLVATSFVDLWSANMHFQCLAPELVPVEALTGAVIPYPTDIKVISSLSSCHNYTTRPNSISLWIGMPCNWDNICSSWSLNEATGHPALNQEVDGIGTFDHIGHAYISTVMLITMEGWTAMMYAAIGSSGYSAAIVFVTVVFAGGFILSNLLVVVVHAVYRLETVLSQEATLVKQHQEREKECWLKSAALLREKKLFSGDVHRAPFVFSHATKKDSHSTFDKEQDDYDLRSLASESGSESECSEHVDDGDRPRSVVSAGSARRPTGRRFSSEIVLPVTAGVLSGKTAFEKFAMLRPRAESVVSRRRVGSVASGHRRTAMHYRIEEVDVCGVTCHQNHPWRKKDHSHVSARPDGVGLVPLDPTIMERATRTPTGLRRSARCFRFLDRVSRRAQRIISSWQFSTIYNLCIIVNMIIVASVTAFSSPSHLYFVDVANGIFSAVYLLELCIEIFAYSPKYYLSVWHACKFVVVISGVAFFFSRSARDGSAMLSILSALRPVMLITLLAQIPMLRLLMLSVSRSVSDTLKMSFLMIVLISTYSFVGMQLFGNEPLPPVDSKLMGSLCPASSAGLEISLDGDVFCMYPSPCMIFNVSNPSALPVAFPPMAKPASSDLTNPAACSGANCSLSSVTIFAQLYKLEHSPTRGSFSTVFESFLSVFQVMTLEGWDAQFTTEARRVSLLLSALFFISFIVFGNFIMLSMFVSILLEHARVTEADEEERDLSGSSFEFLLQISLPLRTSVSRLMLRCATVVPKSDDEKPGIVFRVGQFIDSVYSVLSPPLRRVIHTAIFKCLSMVLSVLCVVSIFCYDAQKPPDSDYAQNLLICEAILTTLLVLELLVRILGMHLGVVDLAARAQKFVVNLATLDKPVDPTGANSGGSSSVRCLSQCEHYSRSECPSNTCISDTFTIPELKSLKKLLSVTDWYHAIRNGTMRRQLQCAKSHFYVLCNRSITSSLSQDHDALPMPDLNLNLPVTERYVTPADFSHLPVRKADTPSHFSADHDHVAKALLGRGDIYSREQREHVLFHNDAPLLTNPFAILDGIIVVFSVVAFFGPNFVVLRALRPFRFLSRLRSLRTVTFSLVKMPGAGFSPVWKVFILVFVILIVFAMTGVHLFSGRFSYCTYPRGLPRGPGLHDDPFQLSLSENMRGSVVPMSNALCRGNITIYDISDFGQPILDVFGRPPASLNQSLFDFAAIFNSLVSPLERVPPNSALSESQLLFASRSIASRVTNRDGQCSLGAGFHFLKNDTSPPLSFSTATPIPTVTRNGSGTLTFEVPPTGTHTSPPYEILSPADVIAEAQRLQLPVHTLNLEWRTHAFNFDTVWNAMLTLFACLTLEGWITVLYNGVDASRIPGVQPYPGVSVSNSLFFVAFVFVVGFFATNLFITVLLDSYWSVLESREILLRSKEERIWSALIKTLSATSLVRESCPKQPSALPEHAELGAKISFHYRRLRIMCFQLISSKQTRSTTTTALAILFIINCTLLFPYGYNPDYDPNYPRDTWYQHSVSVKSINLAWTVIHIFFTVLLSAEQGLKLIAYGREYFSYNRYIFIELLLLATLFLSLFFGDAAVSSSGLLVFRCAFRICLASRILLVSPVLVGVRDLGRTIWMAVPLLVELSIFGSIILLTYAFAGYALFFRLARGGIITVYNNFDGLHTSLLTLLRSMTGEDWLYIMNALGDYSRVDDCKVSIGHCGVANWIPVTFFVTFMILMVQVVLNLFLAVILEAFSSVVQQKSLSSDIHASKDSIGDFVGTYVQFNLRGYTTDASGGLVSPGGTSSPGISFPASPKSPGSPRSLFSPLGRISNKGLLLQSKDIGAFVSLFGSMMANATSSSSPAESSRDDLPTLVNHLKYISHMRYHDQGVPFHVVVLLYCERITNTRCPASLLGPFKTAAKQLLVRFTRPSALRTLIDASDSGMPIW